MQLTKSYCCFYFFTGTNKTLDPQEENGCEYLTELREKMHNREGKISKKMRGKKCRTTPNTRY